ncbi:molybdopterin dehydrogenase FAD-binding [Ruegeria sp. TM1040]|uniref:xanthine dehydrogenase small subunit n=1 Tax=Ruegeria sp. (strain TM1040) TaxID=292414 RepID=UPI0000462964|nr:xanthine dehydrogenase small subunit [Ruegeria sp. TM1040]ABF65436.1 molybdopterin dehydrogenase FAD-binding [Ruegeria sp. TM1040]MDF9303965.1 xanthine dehydrogenase small subunit [Tritonibacter mobilis]
MAQGHDIRFLLNGVEKRVSDVKATLTLLDYLRLDQRLTGSKEGCAEGDCGACTVLVGRLHQGQLHYETVNACIRFLASLNGCHIVTIEHLSGPQGRLHPVQEAMVDYHGSQCGFCTPGFVMSLYALWMSNPEPSVQEVETAIQGNLCRCTGYEPIVKAAMAVTQYGSPAHDHLVRERTDVTARLMALQPSARIVTGPEDDRAILPLDVADLAQVLAENPKATIVAGSTDVGLWVTKFMRPISPVVFITHLEELKSVEVTEEALTLGAGVTYSESEAAIRAAFPHLGDYWDRIAGWQVRNMGTIGGNIANGSPIGDTPPVLIALGAEVVLQSARGSRVLPLEDFFIDYGKQDREAGDFVAAIRIPRAKPGQMDAAYKISKRRDEDISSVAAGISVCVTDGVITTARIAFGGMAATPKRAATAEAALVGQPFAAASFDAAAVALGQDFTPLSDWRASADYRMTVAANLLRRFYLEQDSTQGAPVRLAIA